VGQEVLGAIDTRPNAKLMRCQPEQRFELSDEMKRRQVDFQGDVADRRRFFR